MWRPDLGAGVGFLVVLLLSLPNTAAGEVNAGKISWSPDVTISVTGLGTAVDDEGVAAEDEPNPVGLESLGPLPASVEVTGFHRLLGGEVLFSLDTAAPLSGSGGSFSGESRDVFRFDGVDQSLEFDGSAEGVPNAARIDAVTVMDGDLVVSFDTSVSLGAVTADDEDLVRVQAGGTYSLLFDGSASGIPEGLDIDGAQVRGKLGVVFTVLLSFDTSGTVGGVSFDDEDVLEYRVAGGTWALVYDGSVEHAAWPGVDLDALWFPPECQDGVDNDGNQDVDFSADAGCTSADDDIEFMEWVFTGIAAGGTIDFTVEGEALQVVTTPGQSVADVAQSIADEINANASLTALGVSAAAHGGEVVTNGSVTNFVNGDPGLSHNPVPVPSLSRLGLALTCIILIAMAVVGGRRQSRG